MLVVAGLTLRYVCAATAHPRSPLGARTQALAFRALRALYACNRNRRLYERLWPQALLTELAAISKCARTLSYLFVSVCPGTPIANLLE